MKLDIQIRDLWETTNYISYRAGKSGNNNLYKYNWKYLSVEIGDIREMVIKNLYAVAVKIKYNLPFDNGLINENCTAIYNNETKIFNLVEKQNVDDPMGVTTLTLINKNTLQIEYLDSSLSGGPGFVYVANLYKKK